MNYFITPNDREIIGTTDSGSIQNAVDLAHSAGVNKVVIPRFNARTGEMVWNISSAILLPSDMTVVLDDCYLRLADGAMCNVFRNSNAKTEIGNTPDGEQHDINIIGTGNATIDGGEPNGLNESTSSKNGLPHISENLFIYLHNVTGFNIEGIRILNQRWWSMAFMFARNGRVAKLDFRLTRHHLDNQIRWRNQDGVDLRVGCSDIIIEDLHGEVGDDFIALTALAGENFEVAERVEGADRDIHDVIIRDIRASTNMCAIIRLLNHFGQKIYNVSMNNIFEISRENHESRTQMVIRLGDDNKGYYRSDLSLRSAPGEMCNITIDNVFSRGLCAVNTCTEIKNLTVRNVHVHSDGGYAYACGFFTVDKVFYYEPSRKAEYDAIRFKPYDAAPTNVENVLIENVFYDAKSERNDAVCVFANSVTKNVIIKNVCNSTELPVLKYLSGDSYDVKVI